MIFKELKLDQFIPKEDVPGFLRRMAQALESNEPFVGLPDLDFNCLRSLKIKIRNEYGQVHATVKAKHNEPFCLPKAVDPRTLAEEEKPEYAVLKRHMKRSYKHVYKNIQDGIPPSEEAVEDFLNACTLMTTYAGFGDDYYAQFDQAAAAFALAHQENSMERMLEALEWLDKLKSRCHNLFR